MLLSADEECPVLHELGLLYEQPQGPDGSIVRDEAYSLSLFQKAADLGYKFSQFRLGCAFEYGLFNLPIDPRQSIKWYSRAAVQEEHQSELALSGWYLTGSEGVLQQSDTEAYLLGQKSRDGRPSKGGVCHGIFYRGGHWHSGKSRRCEEVVLEGCWYVLPVIFEKIPTNGRKAQRLPRLTRETRGPEKRWLKSVIRQRRTHFESKVGKQNRGRVQRSVILNNIMLF